MPLMNAARSRLAVIDMQARLLKAIHRGDHVTDACRKLLTAAERLGIPAAATEQNPAGIGSTVAPLAERLPLRFPKVHFDASNEPAFLDWARAGGTVVLCGVESHVCVLQTALGLRAHGLPVAVVADAVGSRHPDSRLAALERLRRHDVEIVTLEMTLFEWLERYDRPEFRELLPLIK